MIDTVEQARAKAAELVEQAAREHTYGRAAVRSMLIALLGAYTGLLFDRDDLYGALTRAAIDGLHEWERRQDW
jgi:hypothetical protein